MDIKVPFLKAEVGAGDLVKTATQAVGIRQSGDCGCRKRQEALNAALKFVPSVISAAAKCDKAVLLKQGNAWIVWSITEGQYANPHRFEGLDEEARQEYARRCR